MEKYQYNRPDYISIARHHAKGIGWWVGVFFAAVSVLRSLNVGYSWQLAAAFAVTWFIFGFAGGWVGIYNLLFLWPAFGRRYGVFVDPADPQPIQINRDDLDDDPNEWARQHQAALAEVEVWERRQIQPSLEDRMDEWDRGVEESEINEPLPPSLHRWFVGRATTPDWMIPYHLRLLHDARRLGHIETLSQNTLNGIGISRWGTPNKAQEMIDFLLDNNVIQPHGQVYKFTISGSALFPYSPTPEHA